MDLSLFLNISTKILKILSWFRIYTTFPGQWKQSETRIETLGWVQIEIKEILVEAIGEFEEKESGFFLISKVLLLKLSPVQRQRIKKLLLWEENMVEYWSGEGNGYNAAWEVMLRTKWRWSLLLLVAWIAAFVMHIKENTLPEEKSWTRSECGNIICIHKDVCLMWKSEHNKWWM